MREPQNRGLVNWIIAVSGLKFLYDLYALARGWIDFGSRAVFIVYAVLLPVALIALYPPLRRSSGRGSDEVSR